METKQNKDVDLWRKKYFQGLDELEHKEKAWKDLEALLRRALARLAVTGYGVDSSLDRRLDRLREAIRQGQDAAHLDALIQRVADIAASLKTPPPEPSGAGATPSRLLGIVLDDLPLPLEQVSRAEALRRSLSDPQADDTEARAREVADLVRAALESRSGAQSPAGEGSGGLLDRLFRSRERTAAQLPEQPDSTTASEVGARLLERLLDQTQVPAPFKGSVTRVRRRLRSRLTTNELERLTKEIARLLSDALSTAGDRHVGSAGASLPPIHEVLIQVVERIDVPESMAERVSGIKHRLSGPVSESMLPELLAGVADLVTDMRHDVQRERQEFEAFLQAVTDRLSLLDSSLQEAESARRESFANGHELEDRLREQVDDMRTSVAGAADLEQLKRYIETGLDRVQVHMRTFIESEESRNKAAEARIQVLGRRTEEMEERMQTLRQRLLKERENATHDPLTGLFNRLAYNEHLEQAHAQWKRYGKPLSLLLIDVDKFKVLNDTFGHQAGDKVLRILATRIKGNVREADFVARYGGEEFVVLMPNTSLEDAHSVAEKLRRNVSETPFHYRDQPVNVSISCGISQFRDDDGTESVFQRADAALYSAKENGRNQCRLEKAA